MGGGGEAHSHCTSFTELVAQHMRRALDVASTLQELAKDKGFYITAFPTFLSQHVITECSVVATTFKLYRVFTQFLSASQYTNLHQFIAYRNVFVRRCPRCHAAHAWRNMV